MSKKKVPETGTVIDDRFSFLTFYAESPMEAWLTAIKEYPEVLDLYTIEDQKLIDMSKCKDCGTWWVSEDCICGECGEDRLSKKREQVYWLTKHS